MTAPWVRDVLDGRPPAPVVLVLGGFLTAPVVLVLGGFLTSPPMYRPFERDLRAAGAADVVARVWAMDWLVAASLGPGPILTRSGRGLLEASRRSEVVSGGAPVLVVGHSAGSVSARLLTSPEPFAGRRLNGSSRIGAIVTLGTPNVVTLEVATRSRVGALAADFANRVVPGPAFAPRTGYLTVASRKVVGRRDGSAGERRSFAVYDGLTPERGRDEIEGDGLIPLASALLPGSAQLVFDDVAHGHGIGRDWYGSPAILARWWPLAIETWRGALLARATASFDGSVDRR